MKAEFNFRPVVDSIIIALLLLNGYFSLSAYQQSTVNTEKLSIRGGVPISAEADTRLAVMESRQSRIMTELDRVEATAADVAQRIARLEMSAPPR